MPAHKKKATTSTSPQAAGRGGVVSEEMVGPLPHRSPAARSLARDEAPNTERAKIGEPEVAIRPGRDGPGRAARSEGKLRDGPTGCDAPDLARATFREPEVAIRSGSDVRERAIGRRNGKLRDAASGRDAADLARLTFREPQ